MTAVAERAVRWTSVRRNEALIGRTASAVNPVIRGALYLFVLAIPFELPHRPIPIEIPTVAGFLFLLSSLLQPSICYRRIPGAAVAFGAYLWVFVIAAVVIGSALERPLVWNMFFVISQLLLILWIASNVMTDARALRGALLALVIACSVRAAIQVLGVATVATPEYGGGFRMMTLGQNPNLSAIILSVGLVLTVGMHLARVPLLPWVRRLAWPLAVLMAIAIVQTGSRGGLLCAVAGLLTYAFRGTTVALRLRNGLLAVAGIALIAIIAWQSEAMRLRFEDSMSAGHLAGRELIYPAAARMIAERPLLGWGPIDNQYEIARRVGDHLPAWRDAHNLVLELFTSLGVVGAVPYLVGVWLCLLAAWRSRTGMLGPAPFAMLVAALMGCMSGTWIAGRVFWFSMAVAIAADNLRRTPVTSRPAVR